MKKRLGPGPFGAALPMILALLFLGCGGDEPGGNSIIEEDEPPVEWTVAFNSLGGDTVESQTVKDGDKAERPQTLSAAAMILTAGTAMQSIRQSTTLARRLPET